MVVVVAVAGVVHDVARVDGAVWVGCCCRRGV